jgi:hypothetical protein
LLESPQAAVNDSALTTTSTRRHLPVLANIIMMFASLLADGDRADETPST